jgi:hypothetical protein
MTGSAIFAFELAIRPDESSQLNFIAEIPNILTTFPQDWIVTQFVPFLTKWLPPNNNTLVTAFLPYIGQLVRASSLDSVSPLFELIFAAADSSRASDLATHILACTDDATAPACLSRLCQSVWDSVQATVPLILGILKTDEEKHVIFSLLITPNSPFKVRYAVAHSIPHLSDGLSQAVLSGLLSDISAKIRGILPVVSASRPFFLPSIAPRLLSDHDWSVRASLASALVNTTDPLTAITIGVQLLKDAVWHVKLCALRSLTRISRNVENDT